LKPSTLPLADERIVDKSRNVIDLALLRIGLLRQCAFALPTNCYGLDYLIPVQLKSLTRCKLDSISSSVPIADRTVVIVVISVQVNQISVQFITIALHY
jgi:hypothetical protein